MQNNKKSSSVFSSIRVHLLNGSDKVKGIASCLIGESVMLTGIRIVEGQNGLFISMPQRKNSNTGEYLDVAFPISKEVREELSLQVLGEFSKNAHSDDLKLTHA